MERSFKQHFKGYLPDHNNNKQSSTLAENLTNETHQY